MDTRTRIILAAELAAQALSICAIARQLDCHVEAIGLWPEGIRIEGLSAFLERHHYYGPHLGVSPMRPPLVLNSINLPREFRIFSDNSAKDPLRPYGP
jgi:hypothetical protein